MRHKFSRSVAPDILERISDQQLIDHYFANADSKIRLIQDKKTTNLRDSVGGVWVG